MKVTTVNQSFCAGGQTAYNSVLQNTTITFARELVRPKGMSSRGPTTTAKWEVTQESVTPKPKKSSLKVSHLNLQRSVAMPFATL